MFTNPPSGPAGDTDMALKKAEAERDALKGKLFASLSPGSLRKAQRIDREASAAKVFGRRHR